MSEFSWVIVWNDTGEITEKPGYAYPHTAMRGARAFVKEALKYRERSDLSPIVVKVVSGRWDKEKDYGTVMKYWEGNADEFVKGAPKSTPSGYGRLRQDIRRRGGP